MRAAIPTEAQLAPVAALRYLHIALRHAPQQHEGAFCSWHSCAKRPARQGLTIGTVANDYIVGIHHCSVANLAAVTATVNFHGSALGFRTRSLCVLACTELKAAISGFWAKFRKSRLACLVVVSDKIGIDRPRLTFWAMMRSVRFSSPQ